MHETEYNNIEKYILEKICPDGMSKIKKSNWKKKCNNYFINQKELWYKTSKYGDVKVIKGKEKMESLLIEFHIINGKHLGKNKM